MCPAAYPDQVSILLLPLYYLSIRISRSMFPLNALSTHSSCEEPFYVARYIAMVESWAAVDPEPMFGSKSLVVELEMMWTVRSVFGSQV